MFSDVWISNIHENTSDKTIYRQNILKDSKNWKIEKKLLVNDLKDDKQYYFYSTIIPYKRSIKSVSKSRLKVS